MEINLSWMFPDILSLHGERGSVQAFERVAKNLGVTLNVKKEADENTDIMLFLPGELKVIPTIKEKLDKEYLQKYIEAGKYLICIGTTGSLLAKEITREDGSKFDGLGLLDMNIIERKMVIGDDLHFYINKTKQEIIGSQIQMLDIERGSLEPLGYTLYGYGNSGKCDEGARYKNAIFTNCLGPVFVKNPWWAEEILKDIIVKKLTGNQSKEYDLENKSFETTKRFIKEKPKE